MKQALEELIIIMVIAIITIGITVTMAEMQ